MGAAGAVVGAGLQKLVIQVGRIDEKQLLRFMVCGSLWAAWCDRVALYSAQQSRCCVKNAGGKKVVWLTR